VEIQTEMTSPRTRAIDGKPRPDGRVEDLRIIYGPNGEVLKDYRKPPREANETK
jgi:hypothetical protein